MTTAVEAGKEKCKEAKNSLVPLVWYCFLFVVTLLAGLSQTTIARADDIGLNFDLASSDQTAPKQTAQASVPATSAPPQLPAAAPPSVASSTPGAIAFNSFDAPARLVTNSVINSATDLATNEAVPAPTDRRVPPHHFYNAADHTLNPIKDADIFAGGSDSLVARAVGSAEGTRTPNGDRTSAYYGHVDPGNGVWNLGSFSYQHAASSPEDADERQLKRLQSQAATLQAKAVARSLNLTLTEKLNGIDLANQSPRAALEREGYIDRLAQAREIGLQGSEAVLWARTRSFLDPDSQRWNAPGLGNNVYSISHDQERRQQAIEQAIEQAIAAQPSQPSQLSGIEQRPPDTVASTASAPPKPPTMDEAQSETVESAPAN